MKILLIYWAILLIFTNIKAEIFEDYFDGPTLLVQVIDNDTIVKLPLIVKSVKKTNNLEQIEYLAYINNFNDTSKIYYTYYGNSKQYKTISYYNKHTQKKRINLYDTNKKLIKKDFYYKNRLYQTIDYTQKPPKVIKYDK